MLPHSQVASFLMLLIPPERSPAARRAAGLLQQTGWQTASERRQADRPPAGIFNVALWLATGRGGLPHTLKTLVSLCRPLGLHPILQAAIDGVYGSQTVAFDFLLVTVPYISRVPHSGQEF